MIFYFTATGNSLYIAKQLDEKPISISQELKKESLHYKDDSIGIVVPDYAGELPQIVRRFLHQAKFETDYLYMIITYGKNQSVVSEWSYYFGKMVDVHFDYIQSIRMVDNYLPHFDMAEEMAMDKKIPEQLARIQKDLHEKKHFIEHPADQNARDAYEAVSRWPKDVNNGSGIHVNQDRCVGCGMCTLVCPIGNFHLIEGKAQRYANQCEYCLACAHHCSVKAITIASEKNPNARFINEHIKISEIIQANRKH